MKTVKFTAMKDGDREDYEFLTEHETAYTTGTADRLLDALVELDQGLSGYRVTRLGHSLQAATRAWRDGADTDWIVAALLHDIGDIYAPYNHDEYAAAIIKPFVREQCTWVVEKHGDFQRLYYAHHLGGNPHARDRFAATPYFETATGSASCGNSRASIPTTTICSWTSSGPSWRRCFGASLMIRRSSVPASACRSPIATRPSPGGFDGKNQDSRLDRRRRHRRRQGRQAASQRHRRRRPRPRPEAQRKVGEVVEGARRAYRKMLPDGLPAEGGLRFAGSIADAVEGAELVQESVPERLELKHTVLAEIDAHAPPRSIVGSSTSGIKPSDMQKAMARHPERLVVAHPFNPVYLLPLVEIVGGERTGSEAIDAARRIYASIGMKPVVIRKEIEAFVGDRLLEAAWREALWLVKDDIVTVEELDDIMRYSFGLRWAQMGMFQVYRVAGGEAGMRHFMAQFGPCLAWPWTRLMDVPELTEELVDKIATQSDEQARGLSIRELERIRDDNLVAIMEALGRQNEGKGWGAGALYNDYTAELSGRVDEAGRPGSEGG